MKSIMAVLIALFCLAGLSGACATAAPHYDKPYNSVAPGGVWLQDQSFLAGNSGMDYQVLDMQDGHTMVVVQTAVASTDDQVAFVHGAMTQAGVYAVYFPAEHVVYKANGDVIQHVTLDLSSFPAIERALKTLF
jgi:hypothetical protein